MIRKIVNELLLSSNQEDASGDITLWVFGYGSLIWNPGFEFTTCVRASVSGFSRKFWHANTHHRGTKTQPGRVATLVSEKLAETYGMAFKLVGLAQITKSLEHLYSREVLNGDYFLQMVQTKLLESDEEKENSDGSAITLSALTCVANPKSALFLGPTERLEMTAMQIALAEGIAGPNCDYLFKLAESIRRLFPAFDDSHLFELEAMVASILLTNEQK